MKKGPEVAEAKKRKTPGQRTGASNKHTMRKQLEDCFLRNSPQGYSNKNILVFVRYFKVIFKRHGHRWHAGGRSLDI